MGLILRFFKLIPLCSASNSSVGEKLVNTGISLKEILDREILSKESTWQSFHNKEITCSDPKVYNVLL